MGKAWSLGLWGQPEVGTSVCKTRLERHSSSWKVSLGRSGACKITSPVITSLGLGLPQHWSGWELTRVMLE